MPDFKLHSGAAALALLFTNLPLSSLHAAPLKSAEITAIVNEVSVVNSGQNAHPAKLDETISGQSSVQTGLKSRTELLFSDKTMARLGANSMFSFTNGTRDLDLKQGTMLLQVPKGAGGAKITTAAVTAAITGTTIMIEYFPGGFTKVIVLEGTLRLFLNNRVGESTLLGPGKMVILNPNAKQIPEPVDVDIKRLVKTSKLIQAIDGTDMNMKIVQQEIETQDKEKKKGDLIGTNLVITGSGTEVIIASEDLLNTLQNASFEQQELLGSNNGSGSGSGSNPAPPAPTKYNPVTTITSPNPYVINNTTTIVTDPTITTGGVTNEGTLYNSSQQGSASIFMFGGISAFDTASGFDSALQIGDYSVFRFSSLEFDGSPSINTAGGPNNLYLISEGDINTGSGSFPLAWNNLNFLGLATVNGQISIGSNVTSFTGPKQLDLYARGAAGNIFIDAPITLGPNSTIGLYAESNINVSNTLTATSVNMQSLGNLTLNPSAFLRATSIDLLSNGTIGLTAGNIDTSTLTSFNVNGKTINFSGNAGFSSANANFTAGTGGFNATATPAFYAASLLSSGNITIANTFSNPAVVNISGIIAASGSINVDGQLTAGSIGAAQNITAKKLTSSTNINSTLGNILTTSGDMIATNNITAGGTVNSAGSIVAGDLLKGTSISATGGISSGSMQSTSGDITASGGNMTSTVGDIASVGKITSGYQIISSGNITAASDIIAGNDPSATQDLSAVGSITSTTGDILNTGTGNISAGTTINAAGSLGTAAAGSSTTATGTIIAGTIAGPSSGTSTFNGSTITAGTVASNSVILNAATVTINNQATGLNASVFSSSVQNLTLKSNTSATLTLSSDLGSLANPLNSLTTNANVSITGTNSLYVIGGTLGGTYVPGGTLATDLTLTGANGNLYADTLTVKGNIYVNQIRRTTAGLAGGTQSISANGSIGASGSYGLDFQGTGGTNGGKLSLEAPDISFGTGVGQINNANFVGGDSTSTSTAGTAGNLTVKATSGAVTVNSGSSIIAHGGANTGGGSGGDGGIVSLTATSAININGSVKADGGGGSLNGGKGGQVKATINAGSGSILVGSSSSITADGGNGSTGNGGNGGTLDFQATLSNGSISSIPYGIMTANGGNGLIGGDGGSILWTATGTNGTISNGSYSSSSVNGGNSSAGQGGSAGTIDFKAVNVSTLASTTLLANGGDSSGGNAEGGNGGTINMTSSTGGTINVAGNLTATTGTNSGTVNYGGNGGTVKLSGGGPVTVSGIIKTSDDSTTGKMSKNGGKITITSAETDALKPGITIANTGQLLALLNAAAPGKGGTITFTSAGGKIDLAGTVNAGKKGQTGASGTDGVLSIVNNGASGAVNIASTASLRGDVIKVGVFGNNGQLNIGGGTMNADTQLKLYAAGNNAAINFTGNATLTSPATIIAGRMVTVNNGVTVTTAGSAAQIYTNVPNYSGSGGNGATTGTFGGLGATTAAYGGQPAF